MITIPGHWLKPVNEPVLGRITRRHRQRFSRQDFILIQNQSRIKSGYAAVLATENVPRPSEERVLLCKSEDLNQLNEDDVVLIQPDGIIHVVYEKTSVHNALFVTERCNAACIMCPQVPVSKEEDKMALILRIISLISRDTVTLGITGGEPTLIGDKLVRIIDECRRRLPQTSLLVLTNGIRLEDFGYAKRLAMIKHPSLNFDIALYSDTDSEHNAILGTNGFYRAIKGLYNLALLRQSVGIRIVIHRLNYLRLPSIAAFIYHNFPFVKHIAFMQMETTGLASKNIRDLWIDPFDYNDQLQKAVGYLWRRGMQVSIYNAQLCVLPRALWGFARKSISTWKNVFLDICNICCVKGDCAGFFAGGIDYPSGHIRPIGSDKEKTA